MLDHIGAELEENLGAIEEVTDYVKIVRSYALLSLRFLKSLSVIGGERLYDNRLESVSYVLPSFSLNSISEYRHLVGRFGVAVVSFVA